jgi:hypothetical protein
MEKIMNFKRMEVTGATKEEALESAPFGIQGDATQAYRNARKAHTGAWTDSDTKEFMLNYLAKKSKNLPGVGFSITIESAVADTRERPYVIGDLKNEQGARKYKTVYRWVDDETGKVISETDSTKADAKAAIKTLYTEGSYRGNAHLVMDKKCVEGQAVVATAKYTPSKSSRVGTYLVFGIENA